MGLQSRKGTHVDPAAQRSGECRWGAAVAVLSCAFGIAIAAQPPKGPAVVGLLFLPEVFGTAACAKFASHDIPLFDRPEASHPVGWIRATERPDSNETCFVATVNVHRIDGSVSDFPAVEYQEEMPRTAAVLERRGPWFKVRLREGAAWLERANPDADYSPLESLFGARTFLTDAWDGKLASRPGGVTRRAPSDPRRRVIGYLDPIDEHFRTEAWIPVLKMPDPRAPELTRCRIDRCSGPLVAAHSDAVIVVDRRHGWFQVAVADEDRRKLEAVRGWVQASPAWRFHAVTDGEEQVQLEEKAWGREHEHVNVTDFARVGGALWLKVDLLSHSPEDYDRTDNPAVTARGWIPAHNSAGDLTVWFFTRD